MYNNNEAVQIQLKSSVLDSEKLGHTGNGTGNDQLASNP